VESLGRLSSVRSDSLRVMNEFRSLVSLHISTLLWINDPLTPANSCNFRFQTYCPMSVVKIACLSRFSPSALSYREADRVRVFNPLCHHFTHCKRRKQVQTSNKTSNMHLSVWMHAAERTPRPTIGGAMAGFDTSMECSLLNNVHRSLPLQKRAKTLN